MGNAPARLLATSIAVTLVALSIGTVLAGCGGDSTATTPEPTPAADVPPPAEPTPPAEPAPPEPSGPPPSPEESVPLLETAPELVGVELERTGGIAAVPGGERWEVRDPAALESLRALLPEPVPEPFDRTSPCADCYLYELVVFTKLVGVTLIYRFDDTTFPEELRPLVDALTAS